MKTKYFGYVFAVVTLICFWIAIADRRGEYGILGIVIGCFAICLMLWEDDDTGN